MKADGMNVLLIGIDTLRADHLRCYGYARKTSPNIDKLAESGVLFLKAFAPGIPTHPGWTTILTGMHPINHEIVCHVGNKKLDDRIPMIQEVLKENGYVTAAVDNLGLWFRRGFDYYIHPGGTPAPSGGLKVQADEINTKAINWLKKWAVNKKKNFFLFLHYWDPHTPYIPPSPYDQMYYEGDKSNPMNRSMNKVKMISPLFVYKVKGGLTSQQARALYGDIDLSSLVKNVATWYTKSFEEITDVNYVIAQYDGEIRYVDNKIGELIEFMENIGIYENTLIVLTSDHGESLTEHDISFEHHGLYDTVTHVPLIFHCPKKITSGVKIRGLVQHIDIAPTILEFLGIPKPASMEGRNLLNMIHSARHKGYNEIYLLENTFQCKRAIRTENWKLIETLKPDLYGMPKGFKELYDLKRDPSETVNLIASEKDIAKELSERLEKWIKSQLKGRPDPLLVQESNLKKLWFGC